MKVVTVEQMRELEEASARLGVSERTLMESAGLAAAQEAWMAVGASEERGIIVLVGPGNNGGDGLVTAKHLAGWGAAVAVYLLRPRAAEDEVWREFVDLNLPHSNVGDDPGLERLGRWLGESSCVIDALLGTGASRPIEGDLAAVLARLAEVHTAPLGPRLIALDLPTGVDPDTGHADPATVAADQTVAFGYRNVGLLQMPGARLAGSVITVDIGIPKEAGGGALPYEEIDFRGVQALLPARPEDGHKGTFGRAVVAAGSRRYPGAARLASEAAARAGAGLTVLAAPAVVQPLVVPALPDVIHEPLPSKAGAMSGDIAARALLRALPEANALLLGPGLSHTPATEEFVRFVIAGLSSAPHKLHGLVLDADALNVLAATAGWNEQLTALEVPRVLTPHPGEMARLAGVTTAEVQADRLGIALVQARRSRSVVVLKGACTIVAAPDGRARISPVSNSMLATGGTGDVLAGLITGLIAQGIEAFDAAAAAVYMHGEAARAVTEAMGAAAGLAHDLLPQIGPVRRLLDGGTTLGATSPFGALGGGMMGGLAGLGGAGGLGGAFGDALGGFGGPV
ncbi:MAG: NAD(P)H-hydrate dehydratase [Dehalococcoidia bacterium]|nr:NAD(P)H-hydrate dehydratase [Dehalococcoidia bacterium]